MNTFNKIHRVQMRPLPNGGQVAYVNPNKGNGLSALPRNDEGETLLVEWSDDSDSFQPMTNMSFSNDLDTSRLSYGAWIDKNNDGIPGDDEVTTFEELVGARHDHPSGIGVALTTDIGFPHSRTGLYISEEMYLLA